MTKKKTESDVEIPFFLELQPDQWIGMEAVLADPALTAQAVFAVRSKLRALARAAQQEIQVLYTLKQDPQQAYKAYVDLLTQPIEDDSRYTVMIDMKGRPR